jgi:hypothetical protein
VAAAHEISNRHFAGVTTHYLLAFLQTRLSADALATVFERAGETRPIDELMDETSWSSYPQMRRLLEASAEALGGRPNCAGREFADGRDPVRDLLTSPDRRACSSKDDRAVGALLADPADVCDGRPRRLICTQRLEEGFEPFRGTDFTRTAGVVPNIFRHGRARRGRGERRRQNTASAC